MGLTKYLMNNKNQTKRRRTRPISYGTIINFQFWLLLFLLPVSALAASIFVETPGNVKAGENFSIDIKADTDEISINSVNLTLSYDKELLSFAGYTEDGLVKLWVDSPREENGNIYLGGIIPGGVAGVYDPRKQGLGDIPIVRLLFTSKRAGSAQFSIIQSLILKNDGKGSSLEHSEAGAEVAITESANEKGPETPPDQSPPLPFAIEIIEPSLFALTPSLLIFDTVDLDSGVKSYEIKVGSGDWQEARSPAPIKRGLFTRNIIVRAYDFNNNFQEASLTIPGILSNKLLLLILVLILSGILGFKVLKSKT